MDVLMQDSSGAAWTTVIGQLQGLRAAAASAEPVMIHTADPAAEIGEVVALIGVFRSYGGRDDLLSVASPYPAPDWILRVRSTGIDRIWYVVPGLRPLVVKLDSNDLVEVPEDLCPALHVRKLDGVPTSVCGNMLDRLVLARHIFVGHCFGAWRECRWMVAAEARREGSRIATAPAGTVTGRRPVVTT